MADDNQNDEVNRQRDVKISDMIGTETIADNDLITIVQGSTNKKISKVDFVDDLGVSGTIVQEGDVLATPVLDPQGSVNAIRNLENGSGVGAEVSAQNGITLFHTFVSGDDIPILTDISELTPVIRSLRAGTNISIDEDGNSLVLNAGATQTVEVNSNYMQTASDSIIWCTGNLTITLLDPAQAVTDVTIRSISGTVALSPSVGTTETTELTTSEAQRMGPRASGWFNL